MLAQLHLLSVPTVYRDPKGLYVLESLAAGVPVVQPNHGAFPELLAATGGGRLVPPQHPEALAAALHELLLDHPTRRQMAAAGRTAVHERFNARRWQNKRSPCSGRSSLAHRSTPRAAWTYPRIKRRRESTGRSFRRDRTDHAPSMLLGSNLDLSVFGQQLDDFLHDPSAFLDVPHLASAKDHRHLDLVFVLEEP